MSDTSATRAAKRNRGLATRGIVLGGVLVPVAAGVVWAGMKIRAIVTAGDQAAERGAVYQDAVAPIDPALLQWHQTRVIETGLKSVRGFTIIQDGGMAVAGERLVRVLDANGKIIRDLRTDGLPQAVAAGSDGTLYVGLKDRVAVYSGSGDLTATWPVADNAFITCVSVTPEGVYVADAGNRVVKQFDRAGKLLRELGREDEAKHVRGIVAPSAHLDVAAAGDLVWITNPGRHSLEAYDATGTVVRQWGQMGNTIQSFPGCCNPTDFAMFADGSFVVAEKGVPRVKVYRKDGEFESVVAGAETFDAEKLETVGMDVAVDAAGRVLVLDPVKRAVRVFERK